MIHRISPSDRSRNKAGRPSPRAEMVDLPCIIDDFVAIEEVRFATDSPVEGASA
jgi:hypothetical protein